MNVVISTLSHSRKAVVGKVLAVQEAEKCSTFLEEGTAGSWRQTRRRKSVFELGYFAL